LDEVDEAIDERLKSYDEERVMQEYTLFQMNDRVRSLEEEMMEVKGRLQMTEQRVEDAEAGLVVTQQMVLDLEERNQAALSLATFGLMLASFIIRADTMARFSR